MSRVRKTSRTRPLPLCMWKLWPSAVTMPARPGRDAAAPSSRHRELVDGGCERRLRRFRTWTRVSSRASCLMPRASWERHHLPVAARPTSFAERLSAASLRGYGPARSRFNGPAAFARSTKWLIRPRRACPRACFSLSLVRKAPTCTAKPSSLGAGRGCAAWEVRGAGRDGSRRRTGAPASGLWRLASGRRPWRARRGGALSLRGISSAGRCARRGSESSTIGTKTTQETAITALR
jgi:hypothetical protein